MQTRPVRKERAKPPDSTTREEEFTLGDILEKQAPIRFKKSWAFTEMYVSLFSPGDED